MTVAEVHRLFESSPAIRLVRRKENAPLVVAFLFSAFKADGVTGPRLLSQVNDALEAFLGEMAESGFELPAGKTTAAWLKEWAGEDAGLVRIWHDESSREALVELTAEAERVLLWMQGCLRREHVGVESKVREIWRDMEEIVELATDNPDARLLRLERQIEELEKQAKAIRDGTDAFVPAGARVINERFGRLVAKVRELPGDFREVEDRLRRIAREVSSRALEATANRGQLVGFALDAHTELRESPQGQSVDGFMDFLRPPELQEEFIQMVELINSVNELSPDYRQDATLRNFFGLLSREVVRVQASRQRLVGVLRNVLDAQKRRESQAVTVALRETMQLIHQHADALYAAGFRTEIADEIWINGAMSRPLWQEATGIELNVAPEEAITTDLSALRAFLAMAPVNLDTLRDNIRDSVARRPYATLADVVRDHPPTLGVVEVLGYILLALNGTQNAEVDENQTEIVELTLAGAELRRLRCPSILFAA